MTNMFLKSEMSKGYKQFCKALHIQSHKPCSVQNHMLSYNLDYILLHLLYNFVIFQLTLTL